MSAKLPIKCGMIQISCLCIIIALASQLATCLPNLRIQVNNDNLKSPPYLLDAIERAESAELQKSITSSQAPSVASTASPANESSNRQRTHSTSARENAPTGRVPEATTTTSQGASEESDPSNESSVREELIEEMLDLEPESVLKLSPSNLIDSVDLQEGALAAGGALSHSQGDHSSQADSSLPAEARLADDNQNEAHEDHAHDRLKSQLPVTSSHLKRPVIRVSSDHMESALSAAASDESLRAQGSPFGFTAPPLTIELRPLELNQAHKQATTGAESPPSAGAKSRVSPSVASDEVQESAMAAAAATLALPGALEKKTAPLPPDTWEPNQVMAGVTNASHVPATVRRQYGAQTRTRITLGGGYQRNKLPALANPNSDSQDAAGEAASRRPLREERPVRSHEIASLDNSRVIEIPERIVLPSSVFKQQVSTNRPTTSANNFTLTVNVSSSSSASSIVRKRDSRCPSNGVSALEHPAACDKYYLCEDGYSSERTCPNGLMYGTRDVVRDYCVHRWQVVCGDKSMPNPISTPGCRWQNGIFNVQGSPKCTPDFYECTDGLFEVKKCTLNGQVYDDKTKSCQFAEQVGCAEEALAEFRCPADDQTNTYWPFPRYFLNERALIHCINDKPEIIRCRDYERVDPENLFCVPLDKSALSPADETGGAAAAAAAANVEVAARRAPARAKNQREKGDKVKVVEIEDEHSSSD